MQHLSSPAYFCKHQVLNDYDYQLCNYNLNPQCKLQWLIEYIGQQYIVTIYRSSIQVASCYFLLLAHEDGLTGEQELKMALARRHTISNAMRAAITSGSSSERSSLSPPPSDITPSASHSDINSEEILSDVTSDHDNKVTCHIRRKTLNNVSYRIPLKWLNI